MWLILSTLGYSKIIALDVEDHVRIESVNKIVDYLKQDGIVPSDIKEFAKPDDIKEILSENFNIDLFSPRDSANSGLRENSVDFIYSEEVFEHIGPDLLPGIMRECHRVLKSDGVISLYIDYSDHYGSADKKNNAL